MAEMSKEMKKWNLGAWTPDRCAVWHKLEGEARVVFERWVQDEPKTGHRESELLPEHVLLIAG